MNKIVRKKLDAFAKRHRIKPDHKKALADALRVASARQAEVILSQASTILMTHRLVATPASPILAADGKPQEAASIPQG